jgi:hypothetical protein
MEVARGKHQFSLNFDSYIFLLQFNLVDSDFAKFYTSIHEIYF